MKFKTRIAIIAARTSHFILKSGLHRSATALPGKIALKIDPDLLRNLNEQITTVLVTGTNGKTLTTALCAKIMRTAGFSVITNSSGSNMIQGLVNTLIMAKPWQRSTQKKVAILEVDEANMPQAAAALKPQFIVLTNIFRDQMDRYGEIYTTYDKILTGIKEVPQATLITNGDSPIFQRKKPQNRQIYYGFNLPETKANLLAPSNTDGILSPTDNSILRYHFLTYANLGDYYSVTDDFKRPPLDYRVTKINKLTPKYSEFEIDHLPLRIEIGGLYNIYNALAAFSLASEMGVNPEIIKQTFEQNQQIFGRQEAIALDEKELTIVLIKNPVGANAIIDLMLTENEPFSLGVLLNANYADGIDTSWIWDADFEKLHQAPIKAVFVGGERYQDIHVRLKMGGFTKQKIEPNLNRLVASLTELPTKKIYVAATYTAMLQLREQLAKSGYLKGGF